MTTKAYPYYSIVTFGSPSRGERKPFYRSFARACSDASTLGGGSCTNVRIVGCGSRQEAVDADISGQHDVVRIVLG